ncbi:hypothetical protein [Neisseria yangbaofengii]|uniref:hypothetical protein n=1 Tax=Neisseria yangbaofengii TaxID=2709396 RepID=UPI0013EBF580|nr:hypothetical protein [Neisseria yangbaofengii]
MNNALNAKLSKLVYGSVPKEPDYFAKAHPLDRLILLIRHIYHTLDEQHGLTQVTLRIHCGSKQGQVRLQPIPLNANSAVIRLKRWNLYQRIAEQVLGCGQISVSLANVKVKGAIEQAYCEDIVLQMIDGFGLTADEPALSTLPANNAFAQLPNESSAYSLPEAPSIISSLGKSLSRINTQPKTENYAAAQANLPKAQSIKVSRFSFGGYKQK